MFQESFDRLCLPPSAMPCLQSATVTSDQALYPPVQSSRLSTKAAISSSAFTAHRPGDGHLVSAFQPDQERSETGALNWLQVRRLYSIIAQHVCWLRCQCMASGTMLLWSHQ